MAALSPEQRARYWRFNSRLVLVLLAVWLFVSLGLGGLLAGRLNEIVILGFPLGYYVAAQGALVVFLVETVVYAGLMNARDRALGIREEG